MPNTVLKPIRTFPAGTVVTAHPREQVGERIRSGTTSNGATVTDTATVQADGSLTFTALAVGAHYAAFAKLPAVVTATTVGGSGGASEVQTVTLTNATGGTFTLTYSGQTTAPIAYNADAATVQAALIALSNLAPGDVVVSGTPGAWTVTFGGTLALTNVAQITADGALLTAANRWLLCSGEAA